MSQSSKDEKNYIERLKNLKQFNKPVYIMEFGAATYGDVCGNGSGWTKAEDKKYSEEDQAKLIKKMLDCINQANIDGCFLYHFTDKKRDPRASTSIIKMVKEKNIFIYTKATNPKKPY